MMTSEKVTFEGAQGAMLAARFDRPSGPIHAVALFAHCFTCSKDVFAASRIAGALAHRGVATLRFDFTGLGASAGEFANTGFASNVEDLRCAARWLRRNHVGPALLVGHSLGGAAMLAVAADIPEARAVATIGAPAEPSHVAHLLEPARAEVESRGEAEVTIAGRTFCIRKQFLADIEQTRLAERIGRLRRALLVLDAPKDQVVGIGNAAAIFRAARHPKSFVCLDGADHLLSNHDDARYIADLIRAWTVRYLLRRGERDDDLDAPSSAPSPDMTSALEIGSR